MLLFSVTQPLSAKLLRASNVGLHNSFTDYNRVKHGIPSDGGSNIFVYLWASFSLTLLLCISFSDKQKK